MGITYVDAEVSTGECSRVVSFLVDSGAGYSLLPKQIWEDLQLKAQRQVTVDLADGTRLPRNVAECKFTFHGCSASSPVLLGEEGDEALLGAVTLENLGLVLDPLKRRLKPMSVRL